MKTDTYIAELSTDMLLALAEQAARDVHALLVSRHLRRTGTASSPHIIELERHRVAALRRFIRGLRHGAEVFPAWPPHKVFRGYLKHYLDQIFTAKGTERRWQDYVASVARHNRVACPAPGSPDWATFVLHVPAAA